VSLSAASFEACDETQHPLFRKTVGRAGQYYCAKYPGVLSIKYGSRDGRCSLKHFLFDHGVTILSRSMQLHPQLINVADGFMGVTSEALPQR
jgi:hypothetical protein